MQATTHPTHDTTRTHERLRTPWVVWLIGVLLIVGCVQFTRGALATDGVSGTVMALVIGFDIGISLLIGWGLWRRHPLVHRLYLILSILSLVLFALGLALAATRGQAVSEMLEGWPSLLVTGAFVVGLTRPSTRAWFGLQCPRCDSQRIKPTSLGMRRLACKACEHAWDRRAPHTVDAATFD